MWRARGSYTFDAHNLRVKKFAWNTTYEYIYSKALGNKMLALYINGGVSREYVYVGGTLIATRLSNGVIQYHHSDHLSVRVTSDASGSVIGYQGHYPFGESWYSNNAPFYNYRFTSYGWDNNVSHLYYASNRFYNYQVGRFQTPDLLDLTSTCSGPGVSHRLLNASPQRANLFSYVINDPINRVDPLGLCDLVPCLCSDPETPPPCYCCDVSAPGLPDDDDLPSEWEIFWWSTSYVRWLITQEIRNEIRARIDEVRELADDLRDWTQMLTDYRQCAIRNSSFLSCLSCCANLDAQRGIICAGLVSVGPEVAAACLEIGTSMGLDCRHECRQKIR